MGSTSRAVLAGAMLLGMVSGTSGNFSPAFSDSAALMGSSKTGASMLRQASSEPISMMSQVTDGKYKKTSGGSGGARSLPPPLAMASRGTATSANFEGKTSSSQGSSTQSGAANGGKSADRAQGDNSIDALLQQLRVGLVETRTPGLRRVESLSDGLGDSEVMTKAMPVFDHDSSNEADVVLHAMSMWGKTATAPPKALPEVALPRLDLSSGHAIIPHPLKAYRGGEDVAMEVSYQGHTIIAVFDGVGGWADLGVDPALYARRLADLVRGEFEANPERCLTEAKPLVSMLQKAYDELEASELPGSCTACLALLTSEGKLHVLNIGDSGIHLVRDGKSIFRTPEQQHFFNCPYQLGMGSDDIPANGDYYVLDNVMPGDTIVAATDGTWDNVFVDEVVDCVRAGGTLTAIAKRIAKASHEHGADPTYVSPFATNAALQGLKYFGGKLDDVTVVVSRVSMSRAGEGDTDTVLQASRRKAVLASPVSSAMESSGDE